LLKKILTKNRGEVKMPDTRESIPGIYYKKIKILPTSLIAVDSINDNKILSWH
jgi:hypothetical protein